MERTIKGEVSGDFERLLGSLLQWNISENTKPTDAECEKQAKVLFEAGEGK